MSRRRFPDCGTAPAAARRRFSMAKRMLIDATHPEETRVAVVDGRRLEEFDVEVASKKQLKGNIYLAKITRVEPSLQAAFVEYGGNRHGFLAFSEIHPDYYRIPLEDREALLAEQAAMAREQDEQEEGEDRHRRDRHGRNRRDHGGRGDRRRNESQAGESHDGDPHTGDSHGDEQHDGGHGESHDRESHAEPTPEEIRGEDRQAEEFSDNEPTEGGRGDTQALEAGGQPEFRLSSEPFEPRENSEPTGETNPAEVWPAPSAADETSRDEPESLEAGLPDMAADVDAAAAREENGESSHADGQAIAQNAAADEAPEHR